jgi:hypothetical protein
MSFLFVLKRLMLPLVLAGAGQSCRKQFLDARPWTTLVTPTTLTDFQALLDNTAVFGLVPTLGEASADNYFFPLLTWQDLDTRERNAYIWAPDIFGGQGGQLDWNIPYQQVFYANVVLDGLSSIRHDPDSVARWNALEGSAHFLRAFAYYGLAQVFAPTYDPATANSTPGLPLRWHAEISPLSTRSSVAQTYGQILHDLDSAELYLQATGITSYRNHPNFLAARALRARVCLSMRNYSMARTAADEVLQVYSSLIDYNTLDVNNGSAFATLNAETLYQASFLGQGVQQGIAYASVLLGGFYPNTRIDRGLIRSYAPNDLRRVIYYHYKTDTTCYLKGSYTGDFFPFGGLATDELYLIRAEGAARAGDVADAMNDINTLLVKRWKTGTFIPFKVVLPGEALDTILSERRKELAFRGLRWTDLRRLNAEGDTLTLLRSGLDKTYSLKPNSDLYTLPIPPDVIALNPQIAQNPRN